MPLTITEALAEIKTINKRLEAKRNGLIPFLARQDGVRDPLEKEGGSVAQLISERQSIADLGKRIITLRSGIQRANDATTLTIGLATRTISEWLTWRREVAPGERNFLNTLRAHINSVRTQATSKGHLVVPAGTSPPNPSDFIVNLDERALAAEIEAMEETLGVLDGQLSLKNATVTIQE